MAASDSADLVTNALPPSVTAKLSEMQKQALNVLFPTPEELVHRSALITKLGGRPPNLYQLYCAHYEEVLSICMENGLPFPEAEMNMANWIKTHAPSLMGAGRREAVEIARSTVPEQGRRSLVDKLLGR